MADITRANIADTAVILGVSVVTLRKYIQQGMPVEKQGSRGKSATLYLPEVFEWVLKKKLEDAAGDVSESDAKQLRLRRLKADTITAEINAAKARGEVVFADDALAIFTSEAAAVKAALLSIPGKLSAVLAGKTNQREIRELLTDELYTALEEFTGRTIDYDSILGGEGEPQPAGNVDAPAKRATKRVGRGQSKNTGRQRKAR